MTMEDSLQPSAATEELYHTNLLRLQASQLLSESILPLSSHTGMLENEVKWAKDVWEYVDNIKRSLSTIGEAVISPDDVKFNSGKSEKQKFWIKLHSDKAQKHLKSEDEKNKWNFPFPGGEHLKVAPIYSYAANGAGLTTSVANANVLPTIDLAVLMPVMSKFDDDNEEDKFGMIGGKDYLNGRYFDKRNIFAIHVARFLSQKKQRKKIGSVHVVHELDGDRRKIALILTPQMPSDIDAKQVKKKKKGNDGSAKKKKRSQLRFRVRLVFGTKFDGSRNSVDTNTGWIPSPRLFPDRCNNKLATGSGHEATNDGTPVYNNSIAGDMHYLSNSQILASVSSTALRAFTESWTLLKIWCLQRGFLRGHDTFSEASLGMSLAYLYRSRMVSARMDSVQVFTVWMKFMKDQDWIGEKDGNKTKHSKVNKDTIRQSGSVGYQDLQILSTRGRRYRAGIVMPEDSKTEKHTIVNCIQNRLYASDLRQKTRSAQNSDELPKTLLESFKMNTDAPIFLDPSMTVNYFGNMSPSFMREVQLEATRALDCIHFHRDDDAEEAPAHRVDSFRQLFLESARFWTRYDAYLSLDLKTIAFPKQEEGKNKNKLWGTDAQDRGNYDSLIIGLVKVLRMALGNRITTLRILTTGNGEVESTSAPLLQSTDSGTRVVTESDGIDMIPIRHTSDSSFSGIDGKSIFSPNLHGSQVVIGVCINRDSCHRIVDRGPPANETSASKDFVDLWGEKKAQLRRFKDGAIVHAVVWNEADDDHNIEHSTFESGAKVGDTVEQIIRHILRRHFLKASINSSLEATFQLRNLVSLVEGVSNEKMDGQSNLKNSAEKAHKNIMAAFEDLSTFFKKNSEMGTVGPNETASKLGLPLSIDAVEALSPSLRYSATFPQVPHALLGSSRKEGKKVAGATINDPILIQIRFEGSSKWPSDIGAMGAAKCAMFLQLADGIEKMKANGSPDAVSFDGPINVSSAHIDFGYSGYVWRVIVRADQEIKMLNALRKPTPDAIALRQALTKSHVTRSLHHFTIHGVTSKYAAAGYVVRLVNRWIAAHMLSGLVPQEAVELLVASVFTDPAPLQSPGTVSSGFMRCLQLIGRHDWRKAPLIVDPEGHLNADDRADILSQFEDIRGQKFLNGPPMFIISPNDRHSNDDLWRPSFTANLPENVVLRRLSALARRSHQFLKNALTKTGNSDASAWESVFQESPGSLKSYSALFRVNPDIVVDTSCSSTSSNTTLSLEGKQVKTPYYRTMEKFSLGPKVLRKKVYKNLNAAENILYSFKPVDDIIQKLRSKYGSYAIFFYNEFCPDMIAMLWRPTAFKRQPFSAMHAEFCTPVELAWEENSLVTANSSDVLRAIKCDLRELVIDTKVLDMKTVKGKKKIKLSDKSPRKPKRKLSDADSSTSSSDESE